MSRRWTMSNDIFLAQYHDMGANLVASHDLNFTGKNAGENRVKKLKESGVWDKILAHIRTHEELNRAWVEEFGSQSEKDFLDATNS